MAAIKTGSFKEAVGDVAEEIYEAWEGVEETLLRNDGASRIHIGFNTAAVWDKGDYLKAGDGRVYGGRFAKASISIISGPGLSNDVFGDRI